MRYTVNSAELYSHLQILDKVIVTKNSTTIETCVLFEISGETLNLRSTDKEITLTSRIALAESSGDSKFAVNASQFLEILKVIPEQPIVIDIDTSSLQMIINYQGGHIVLQAENADEFPALRVAEGEYVSFPAPTKALNIALANAMVATSTDEDRVLMQGIFFDITLEGFAIVASDGRKLVRTLIECETSDVTSSFVIPQKPTNIIRSILEKFDAVVNISTGTEGNATFDMGNFTMYCRLLAGNYPNYRKAIPQNNDRVAVVDRDSLISALRRALVVADKGTCLVKMLFDSDKVVITAENNNYAQSAEEQLVCQYDGMPIKIGFPGNYFYELANRISSSEIIIKLSDPSRAGILLPSVHQEGTNLLMLVMPLLITN